MEDQQLFEQVVTNESTGNDSDNAVVTETADASTRDVGKQRTIVTIDGPGLHFERDVSNTQIVSILRLLLGGEQEDGVLGESRSIPTDSTATRRRQEALSEFYRRVGPKRNPAKLVTIAAYLHDSLGRESFTPDELRSQFRQVNEPAPANLPRDFKAAVGAGWIAEEHRAPGQYYVTQSGRDALASDFSVEVKRPSKPRRRRRNSTKKEQEVSANE